MCILIQERSAYHGHYQQKETKLIIIFIKKSSEQQIPFKPSVNPSLLPTLLGPPLALAEVQEQRTAWREWGGF